MEIHSLARSHERDSLFQARKILHQEANALKDLATRLDESFVRALEALGSGPGAVIVIGMGKAGLVGQKIAATFCSTGTLSHFVHPAEAVHGDLGRIAPDDVALVLSYSGETEETVRVLPSLSQRGVRVVAITGNPTSQLAKAASVVLDLGPIKEVCSIGLAPSTSTTAMLALGDALALVLSEQRQFRAEDFARFHPGGSLGRKLARVDEIMRPLEVCRVALESQTVRAVLTESGGTKRRTGAVMITDESGQLRGVFTDSDLARLLASQHDAALDQPIRDAMTTSHTAVETGTLLTTAIEVLVDRKISELPIIDSAGQPRGLIDITDILELLPSDRLAEAKPESTLPPTIVPFTNPQGQQYVDET